MGNAEEETDCQCDSYQGRENRDTGAVIDVGHHRPPQKKYRDPAASSFQRWRLTGALDFQWPIVMCGTFNAADVVLVNGNKEIVGQSHWFKFRPENLFGTRRNVDKSLFRNESVSAIPIAKETAACRVHAQDLDACIGAL
jgi:hypothetical protein